MWVSASWLQRGKTNATVFLPWWGWRQVVVKWSLNFAWVMRKVYCERRYDLISNPWFTVHSNKKDNMTSLSDTFWCVEQQHRAPESGVKLRTNFITSLFAKHEVDESIIATSSRLPNFRISSRLHRISRDTCIHLFPMFTVYTAPRHDNEYKILS